MTSQSPTKERNTNERIETEYMKIVVAGPSGVGKTSLVRHYLTPSQQKVLYTGTTVGTSSFGVIRDGHQYLLIDTAGNEKLRGVLYEHVFDNATHVVLMGEDPTINSIINTRCPDAQVHRLAPFTTSLSFLQ